MEHSFEIKARKDSKDILIPTETGDFCVEDFLVTYAGTNKRTKVNLQLAERVVVYFNITKSTTRKTAKRFKIAHSTVYRYLTKVLPNETSAEILAQNKKERSSRGGRATAAKKRKQS